MIKLSNSLNSKQIMGKIFLTLFFTIFFIFLLTSFSLSGNNSEFSNPISAEAIDISDGATFISTVRSNPTASIVLTNNITINNPTFATNDSTFSGTIDGAGYTINISGAGSSTYNNMNVITGIIAANLAGTIKNVTISYAASVNLIVTNSLQITPNNLDAVNANSFTLTAGIICGNLGHTGLIENVNLTLSSTSYFAVIGNDTRGDKEFVDGGWFGTDWYRYRYLGGAGGVAGGFAGRITSGTIKNVTLDNQGSIFSKGSNQNVGEMVWWGEKEQTKATFTITSSTHACRSAAGGVAGEVWANATKSATMIENLHMKGDGVVLSALLTATSNYDVLYSGNIIGQIYSSNPAPQVTIDGVIYKASNKAATSYSTSNKAGTWVGDKNAGTLTVKNVYRKNDSGDFSGDSSRGYSTIMNTYVGSGSAPTKAYISSNYTATAITGSNPIFYAAWGRITPDSFINSDNELSKNTNLYYGVTQGSSYGDIDVLAFNPDGSVQIKAAAVGFYYISALRSTFSGNNIFLNVYGSEALADLQDHTFDHDKNRGSIRIYYFLTNSSTMSMQFVGYGSSMTPTKTYDRVAYEFSGCPSGTDSLASGLVWISKYFDLNNVPDPSGDTIGQNGSKTVFTGFKAGYYSIAPYRIVIIGGQTTYVELTEGESIAGNTPNAPDTVYLYTKPNPMPRGTIQAKSVTISAGFTNFSKQYDGTPDVTGLLLGQHYVLNGLLTEDQASTTLSFDEESSYFADLSYSPSSTVSNGNKIVILVDCIVENPNYTLTGTDDLELTGCSITKRIVQMAWLLSDGLTDYVPGQPYLFDYTASTTLPQLRVTNPVGLDDVTVSTVTFANLGSTTPIEAKNAGNYVARPNVLGGTDSSNYSLPTPQLLDGYAVTFTINKKELYLNWSASKEFTYNANIRNLDYSCSIVNQGTEVLSGDTVTISISYKDVSNNIVDLRNAGTYSAVASKSEGNDEDNYFISPSDLVEEGIVISPWTIELYYWTGQSGTVQELLYNGTSYINSEDGLHVDVETLNTELSSVNFLLSYQRNGISVGEVRTVGTYIAYSSIVNGATGYSQYYSNNYSILAGSISQEIVIIPKEISIIYGTITFDYDATSKKDTVSVSVNPSDIVSGDSVNALKSWETGATVTNVGTYTLTVTVSNTSYSVKLADRQRTITINKCSILNNPNFVVSPITSVEYSFSEKTPNPEVKYKNVSLIKDVDYSLAFSNNIEAGTANVTITGLGNFSNSVQTNFSITKKQLQFSFSIPGTIIYNAKNRSSEIVATLSGVIPGDVSPELTYEYYDLSNTLTTPLKAGSYKVISRFSELNYRMPIESNRTRNFTILQKELGIVFSNYDNLFFTNANFVIGVDFQVDKSFCPEDVGNIGLQLSHMFGPIDRQQPVENVRNAGQYVSTASLNGSALSNYRITSSNVPGSDETNCTKLTFSIGQKDIRVEFSNNEVDFNNTYQKITYIATDGYAPLGGDSLASITTVYYAKDGRTDTNGAKNAGIYTVNITSHNTNYRISQTTPSNVTFKVNKKQLKLYLTINGQPLNENEEFIYGGPSQNIGNQISYAYRTGFAPITGDTVDVIINLFRGQTRIESAYNVSDLYRVSLELSTTAINYQLVTEIIDPLNDSVLERYFSIKPRPIKVIILESDVTYTGTTSVDLRAGLFNGDGFISELSIPSGIVGQETVNLSTYVYQYDSENYDGSVANSYFYDEGERVNYRDRGTYYVRCIISGESNYYIHLDENNSNEKSFKVWPEALVFSPRNISKTYGDNDPSDFSIYKEGVGEDEEISAILVRESGENVGTYDYIGIQYTGTSNYNVSLNTEERDGEGNTYSFKINIREYQVNPRYFTIEWNPTEPDIDLSETIEIITASVGTIYIDIEYNRTGGDIPDAGIYDLTQLTETPENGNVDVIFAGANGDSAIGKFIVLGRPVSIRVKDFEKIYDQPDPSFYDPAHFQVTVTDLPSSIQDEYNLNPSGYDWSQLIRVTRAPGEIYIPEGYSITYNFFGEEAKNYRPDIIDYDTGDPKLSTKLMINRYVVNIEDIALIINLEKDYDGNNRIDKNSISLTRESSDYLAALNPKLFQKGFKPSARFASSSLGEADSDAANNKDVYVSFSVFEEYSRNYILPAEYLYPEKGTIRKIVIPVTIEIENTTGYNYLTYGDSPTVLARYAGAEKVLQAGNPNYIAIIYYGKNKNSYVTFVGNDNPTSLGLNIRAVYSDDSEVKQSNIRDAGPHTIKLTSAVSDNYIIKTDYIPEEIGDLTSTVNISFITKELTVAPSSKIFKKPVDNTYEANIDQSHYILEGILTKDLGLVEIRYQASLASLFVGPTEVIMSQIELTGSNSANYSLTNLSLSIPANILSLASVSFTTSNERDFNNLQFSVTPTINSYLSGATLKINGQTIYEGTEGQGLDGEGTTINIEVYYTGLVGGYYPKTRVAPKDAGTYNVTCNITNEEGYIKNDAATTTLKINRVTPTISLSGRFRQEYGGFTPIVATVLAPGLSSQLDVEYSFQDPETLVIPRFPSAGTHSVVSKYTPPKTYPINYNPIEKSAELRIIPKQIQVNITGYEDGFTYNGSNRLSEISIDFAGVVSGDSCDPLISINGQSDDLNIINAGTYLIDVTPSNESYVIVGTSSIYLTVNKAKLRVQALVEDTYAGQFPDYSIEFEGFQGTDSPDTLQGLPGLNLSGNNVGTNTAIPKGGLDSNYEYEYIPSSYEVVYESPNSGKANLTMYYVLGGIFGGILVIIFGALFGKRMMLKNMYRAMKKKY
ncbi:MAG: hypothetical protein GXY10_05895 [Clostridiales bacterium]|nr:hypothetical protein [Clostridiales bacterium]